MIPISACDKFAPKRNLLENRGVIIQKGWNVPSLKHLNLWEGVYEDAPKLRRCSLTERLNCLLFTVIDLENGEQFGDLQQVADSLG